MQIFLKVAKSESSIQFKTEKIDEIEDIISQLSSNRNLKFINEQLGQIDNLNGSISQVGIWKVKTKILPRSVDPPMAKRDTAGKTIIFANLYSQGTAQKNT